MPAISSSDAELSSSAAACREDPSAIALLAPETCAAALLVKLAPEVSRAARAAIGRLTLRPIHHAQMQPSTMPPKVSVMTNAWLRW